MRVMCTTAITLVLAVGSAFAQAEQHDGHHPQESAPGVGQTEPTPPVYAPTPPAGSALSQAAPGTSGVIPVMGSMREQCRAALQCLPQECISIMQGGIVGTMGSSGASMPAGWLPPHGVEMQAASQKMNPPIIEATRLQDADEAFVWGMISHHQAAIEMAQTILKYGTDEQVKRMAANVIRAQTREIEEMQDQVRQHGK